MYEEGKNSSEVERTILGIDHNSAGNTLAQRWSFPESLSETISYHHKPEDAAQCKDLVHIVYLADLLMSRFHTGIELERVSTDALASRLETIGFSTGKFPDIVDIIPLGVFESLPELELIEK